MEIRTLPIHRKEAAHVNKIMQRPFSVAQNLARPHKTLQALPQLHSIHSKQITFAPFFE
jgi:hypothetical protein